MLDRFTTWLVRYAFFVGLLLALILFATTFTLEDANSRLGALLINLAGDILIVGLTISVVDKLIKRSERKKLGKIPHVAKAEINEQFKLLAAGISHSVNDAVDKTPEEIVASGMIDDALDDVDLMSRMCAMELTRLKLINPEKLTLGMFSETLRLIRQSLGELDTLIARYEAVLDPQDISEALSLRNELDHLSRSNGLITLTIPFFGKQAPKKPLSKRERDAFMDIKDGVVQLVEKLPK